MPAPRMPAPGPLPAQESACAAIGSDAQALSRRREDRIADRRRHRRHARLRRYRRALHRSAEVHVDLRHLIAAQQPIGVEIGLLHPARRRA